MTARLDALGWDDAWQQAYHPWHGKAGVQPGRVAIEFNHIYRVHTADGELEATASGRLKHHAESRSELPAVGDWVVVRKRAGEGPGGAAGGRPGKRPSERSAAEEGAAIVAVLPRRSRFSRKVAGQVTDEQIVAANVDVVFLVMALNEDYSVRRLERYLLLARESGASPVILLTKPDLAGGDLAAHVAEVVALAGDFPVHVLSPRRGEGLEQLAPYLVPGRTAALLGSSGVGKSTIINRLAGQDLQKTLEVRESDARGRHATTHRELVVLPSGALIVDTPGMRELQLWDVGGAVRETFEDIETLAPECYFSDCRHRGEPRCAVQAAVDGGRLAADRLESYLKLQDELAYLARQQDERLLLEEKRRGKVMGKALRARLKQKGR